MKSVRLFLACILILSGVSALAAPPSGINAEALSQQIRQLKKQVLSINSELNLLEQQLLYPSSETAFFLSVDAGSNIRLVDVNISLDGKHVGYHFYTRQEFEALSKGGIERLFHANVSSGRHTINVRITGYNPRGKNYHQEASYQFTKGPGRKYIEIHLSDNLNTLQPKFEFREWNK